MNAHSVPRDALQPPAHLNLAVCRYCPQQYGSDHRGLLECTVRCVSAVRAREGRAVAGWHVLELHCMALQGLVSSTPDTAGKRRGRPKKTALAAERQQEQKREAAESEVAAQSPPAAAERLSPSSEDQQLYWLQQLDRPRTRSTNPHSKAMLSSKRQKEERERLLQWADHSLSDSRLAAVAKLEAKGKKQQAGKASSGRQQVKLEARPQEQQQEADGGKREAREDETAPKEEEAIVVQAGRDNGLLKILYQQTHSAEQEATEQADAAGGDERGATACQEAIADERAASSPPPLLRCHCSFLLPASIACRTEGVDEWQVGSWCAMRQKTRGDTVHLRIGRIIHIVRPPPAAYRRLRVLWYRTVDISLRTLLPRAAHKREWSVETKSCAVIDTNQQLADVSPWEISRLPHAPVRFPCNVDSSNLLPTLPKPDAIAGEPLSVQASDALLTSLCLEQLYDHLAGHLNLDFDADSDTSAAQQRMACAPLAAWRNSVRQLRERHVAGTLSGFAELADAVQHSTLRLVEAVAYEPAQLGAAASCSTLATRVVCVVWRLLRVLSSVAEKGASAVEQLAASESLFAACSQPAEGIAEASVIVESTTASAPTADDM